MNSQFLVGGHVSAAGGLDKAIDNITAIGGNCVQIFSASPRVWARKAVTPETIALYNQKAKEKSIAPTVIHAMYLVNLASDNPEMVKKSIEALTFDLEMAAGIHAAGVVVHIGSYQDRGFESARQQMAKCLTQLLAETPETAVILIENSAGQGGKVGSKLEEIRLLLDDIASPRLGWCLDSCHAFAAGYSLAPSAEEKYLFDHIEKLNLHDSLKVVHVNDSKDLFFAKRDRHENLFEGKIGKDMMRAFVNHPMVKHLPLILEVPGMDGKSGPDAENIKRLRALLA